MAVRSTVVSKLAAKGAELEDGVAIKKARAEDHEITARELRAEATLNAKQASAVKDALAILDAAGVVI